MLRSNPIAPTVDASISLRGRVFSAQEIEIIQACVDEYYDKGRTFISRAVCERLDWRQPNGWLKDRACRDVLRKLEDMGFITLPPPKVRRIIGSKKESISLEAIKKQYDISTPLRSFPSQIDLVFAKGNKEEKIWNTLVSVYHYLGYKVLVGRNIKYLITSGSKIIGAIGFSSPVQQLKARDALLAQLEIRNPLEVVVNNSRFLLLPTVEVKNLGSHILALATKKIVHDWQWYYSITPLIAETFVLPSRFSGTVYKAANWIEIGMTKGFAKKGGRYVNSQEPKKIFIYGLNSNIRRKLQNLVLQERGRSNGHL